MMFGLGGNNVTAALLTAARQSEYSEIAGFGSAAGENNFVRFYAQHCGELIARIIHHCARVASGRMHARWISETTVETWQHRCARLLTDGRGCVVVEINHHFYLFVLILFLI